MTGALSNIESPTTARVLRKISRRLLPFCILCYLLNYIDRVNISLAKFAMPKDIPDFDPKHTFAVGAAVFFLGYFLFEVPSNLLQQRVGARRWIARIMITWGILSACFLLTVGPRSFYLLRFLLGLAEAGFFPGMILYLSVWIPHHHRARAAALFLTSTAIAGVIGNPLGGTILYYARYLPWFKPWQYLFLFEGLPTVLLGFFAWFVLTDSPSEAKWLTEPEKVRLQALMDEDHRRHPAPHLANFVHAFSSPHVWLLSLLYSMTIFGFYLVNFWTPTLISESLQVQSGEMTPLDHFHVAMLSAIPFGAGAIGMVLIGRSSDRRDERRYHLAFACAILMGGLAFAAIAPAVGPKDFATPLTIIGLSFAAIGAFGHFGPFWSLPNSLLTGTAAATAVALINSLGNLGGGFLGPLVMEQRTLQFGLLVGAALAAGATLLTLFMPLRRRRPAGTALV